MAVRDWPTCWFLSDLQHFTACRYLGSCVTYRLIHLDLLMACCINGGSFFLLERNLVISMQVGILDDKTRRPGIDVTPGTLSCRLSWQQDSWIIRLRFVRQSRDQVSLFCSSNFGIQQIVLRFRFILYAIWLVLRLARVTEARKVLLCLLCPRSLHLRSRLTVSAASAWKHAGGLACCARFWKTLKVLFWSSECLLRKQTKQRVSFVQNCPERSDSLGRPELVRHFSEIAPLRVLTLRATWAMVIVGGEIFETFIQRNKVFLNLVSKLK